MAEPSSTTGHEVGFGVRTPNRSQDRSQLYPYERSPSERKARHAERRKRREARRRAREVRRVALASSFVGCQIAGFWLANFATRDSWLELSGFLLLQPAQILLNLVDSRFQLTRGMRDADVVLLVTLISLPLNILFWYCVWRGIRKLRRRLRRQRHAPGSPYGPAPAPNLVNRTAPPTTLSDSPAAARESSELAPRPPAPLRE